MRYRYGLTAEDLHEGEHVEVGVGVDRDVQFFAAIVERIDPDGRLTILRDDGKYAPRADPRSLRKVVDE
jgi:hypothetical protein